MFISDSEDENSDIYQSSQEDENDESENLSEDESEIIE